jgi:hypothetical protein
MNHNGHGLPGLILLGYSLFCRLFHDVSAAGVLTYSQIFAALTAGIFYLYGTYKKSKKEED